jgi:FAD/FMN-containing dehydrogenase
VGGAVAADIHGKNHHHDGSIGSHVIELELLLADDRRVTCSPRTNAELFWATVGGMGLTGMIVKVTLQLIPIATSSIAAQHVKAPDLEAAFRCFEGSEYDDQYTVAWVDCLSRGRSLGRSVVMRGHHAQQGELKAEGLSVNGNARFNIPIDCPSFVVNPFGVAIFNQLYYSIQGRKTREFVADFGQFFYPLDSVRNWNRLYGKRGFLQYQFMVPEAGAFVGTRRVLERVVSRRRAIFLAVLKRFGAGNPAPLSFPARGYTLTLDLPMTGPDTLRLLDELDDIVLEYGGRVYLAKDARLSADRFRRMYPRLGEWQRVKQVVDPHERFTSDLSRRLGLSGGTSARPPVDHAEHIAHA